jgi:hypothetical protein
MIRIEMYLANIMKALRLNQKGRPSLLRIEGSEWRAPSNSSPLHMPSCARSRLYSTREIHREIQDLYERHVAMDISSNRDS